MSNFTYLQQYSYNVLMAGYSVFLTGDAGTGKTYVLNKFIEAQRARGRNVMVCAPTGIAALHINGVTLHRQFKADIKVNVNTSVYDEVAYELADVDTLVIDEISMCRIDLFELIVKYIFSANSLRRRRNKPRLQIVLSGDFLQLPPVMTEADRKLLSELYSREITMGFAFESEFWNKLNLKYIVLTDVVRQDNKEFLQILNRLRLGDKTALDYIMANCSKLPLEDAVNLYGKNNTATERNIEELNKLPSELYTHQAVITGAAKITDTNADEILPLKVGARVMSLINKELSDGSLVYGNGSLGTVVAINIDYVTVEFDNGAIENIGLHTWEVEEYFIENSVETGNVPKLCTREIGTVVQYPLKLAYAITIHKSQGQTYNSVNINPYAWDCGQLYVALSRVKDIKNLYLTNEINYDYLVLSLNVVKFYNEIIREANKDLDTTVDLTETKQKLYEDNDMNKILSLLGNK